ncbi:MAG: YafY family transcriptional regulator [Clostridiales bacterium]|nr:YafY family transcriptional regulator [Clostridiales bacterium]
MKIDRLIGILSILLQQNKITAPELADRFEVSKRTINRDIENLCKAGIPIQTLQGWGGGIQIMDGYKMDRTLLTSKDMQVIMAGLRSLDSVSGSNYYGQLMEKIKPGSSHFIGGNDSILIDLSSWYQDTIAGKISLIQDAIESRRQLTFDYYSPSGNSSRKIEPYYLIYKWSSWYVFGWCYDREDFRLFKLNRMDRLEKCKDEFVLRDVSIPDLSVEKIFPGVIHVKAIFSGNMKWRLIEEYGPHCFEELEDGKLLLFTDYTDKENLISWLLSFGDNVVLLEPAEVKEEIMRIIFDMKKNYDS